MRKLILALLLLPCLAFAGPIEGGPIEGGGGIDQTNVAITGGSITGITDITVPDGGTGVSTFADGGILVGAGDGPIEVVAPGLTTQILVGGGPATNPVWTTATGTDAPVRATHPTITLYAYDVITVDAGLDGATPPAAAVVLSSTNKVIVRNFDDSSDKDLLFMWPVPSDFSGSTITYRVVTFVTAQQGPVNEGVAFFLQGVSLGDGDILSSALGTAVISSWTGKTEVMYDRIATAWSVSVTVTNIAAGETAILKLYRDVSDAADTYAQNIGVSYIEIKYQKTTS